MKHLIIALLLLASPADAGMRHDRVCDIAQDKAVALHRLYNPESSHFVRFGKCSALNDIPVGDTASLAGYWNGLSCGYQAYRKGKKLNDSPYKNSELTDAWKDGWKYARKSCTEGMFPTFTADDHR